MPGSDSLREPVCVCLPEVVEVWTQADSTKPPEKRTGGLLQAFLQPGITEFLLKALRLLGGPLKST